MLCVGTLVHPEVHLDKPSPATLFKADLLGKGALSFGCSTVIVDVGVHYYSNTAASGQGLPLQV